MNQDEMDVQELRAHLAARDVPCPACGYNLRGLIADVCPECREKLELKVGLAEPRMAAFLTSIIALSAGVGFDLLLMGFFGVMLMIKRQGGGPPWDEVMLGIVLPGGVQLVVLLLLLVRRRWFRTRSPRGRWLIAGGCVLLTLANLVVFSIVVD